MARPDRWGSEEVRKGMGRENVPWLKFVLVVSGREEGSWIRVCARDLCYERGKSERGRGRRKEEVRSDEENEARKDEMGAMG